MKKKVCPMCRMSKHTVKAGHSRGKQRYKCKSCGEKDEEGKPKGRFFTSSNKDVSIGIEKHKHHPSFKFWVCNQYLQTKRKGGSLRKLVKEINEQKYSKPITHSTVLFWLKKHDGKSLF